MSRIGKKAITLPTTVSLTTSATSAVVKGPKGELSVPLFKGITVAVTEGEVHVTRSNNEQQLRALHGLVRSLLANAVLGVTEGFSKTLKMVGTGYRAQAKGKGLSLAVGFSHLVEIDPVEGITFSLKGTDTIVIEGTDKHIVGQVAANIRKVRPPEPYQGKGIRYSDEVVRRKQGKAAA